MNSGAYEVNSGACKVNYLGQDDSGAEVRERLEARAQAEEALLGAQVAGQRVPLVSAVRTHRQRPTQNTSCARYENQNTSYARWKTYCNSGARPMIRNPENKKLLTLLGYHFSLTSTIIKEIQEINVISPVYFASSDGHPYYTPAPVL